MTPMVGVIVVWIDYQTSDNFATVAEGAKRRAEAAQLYERTGEFARAADLYGRAQAGADRARLLELCGRPRAAGLAWERLIAEAPDGPDAPTARLALARLLAGFGRHEDAVRHL